MRSLAGCGLLGWRNALRFSALRLHCNERKERLIPYGADLDEANAQIGKMVGDGECVTLTKRVARLPHASLWHKGEKVKGNLLLKRGTIIATFDKEGRYTSDTFGQSHAAIYLGQDSTGIQVLDRWNHPYEQKVHEHTIVFTSGPISI